MQPLPVSMNHEQSGRAPENITTTDSADAAQHARQPHREERSLTAADKNAGKRKQRFVGNRQPENAEHQQSAQRQRSIVREPIQDGLFHRYSFEHVEADMRQEKDKTDQDLRAIAQVLMAKPRSYASAFAFTGTANGADVTGVMYWGTILESWMTYSGYDTMPCS